MCHSYFSRIHPGRCATERMGQIRRVERRPGMVDTSMAACQHDHTDTHHADGSGRGHLLFNFSQEMPRERPPASFSPSVRVTEILILESFALSHSLR